MASAKPLIGFEHRHNTTLVRNGASNNRLAADGRLCPWCVPVASSPKMSCNIDDESGHDANAGDAAIKSTVTTESHTATIPCTGPIKASWSEEPRVIAG